MTPTTSQATPPLVMARSQKAEETRLARGRGPMGEGGGRSAGTGRAVRGLIEGVSGDLACDC